MELRSATAVFFSPSGTTKTVTLRAAQAIAPSFEELDLLRRPLAQDLAFGPDQLLVVGIPVFVGRVPAVCMESLRRLKGNGAPAVALAVYGNREYEDALLELTDLLRGNGFITLGAGAFLAQHSIFTTVAQGRPDQQDLAAIDRFGDRCRQILRSPSFPGDGAVQPIQVKGNRPYRESSPASMHPTADSKCTACGACAKLCPVGAIDPRTPSQTDEKRCISCTACIAVCPQRARGFHAPAYSAARAAFEQKCAARREPEVFFLPISEMAEV